MAVSDINNLTIIGRLTRDSDLKYINTGSPILNFSLAVNKVIIRDGQQQVDVSFFDVVIWGKLAEKISQYLLKGIQVCIGGELKQERWVDSQSNQNKSRIKIICHSIQMLSSPKDKNQGSASQNRDNYQGNKQENKFDDDIPF